MAENDAKPVSYEEAYQKLRTAYIARLEGSLASMQFVLTQRQLGKLSYEDLLRAQHLAHGLAGSGTTFGFPQVTETGRKTDTFLTKTLRVLPEDKPMDDESFAAFEILMTDMQQACDAAFRAGADMPEPLAFADRHVKGNEAFHVLIVDDDEHLNALLYMKLQQKNIRVTPAQDGNTALRVVAKTLPDLIILDIDMPGLNGHEVLRRLKQNPETVGIPILMLTGKAGQSDVVSALHSGAIDYILKPFNPETLLIRVEKILDAARNTVLIADNDPLILQLLDHKFRQAGFRVVLIDDGKKAWDHILKIRPNLVILDRMMPGLEGLAVLQNMRADSSTRDVPVIILSARHEERDIEMGLKMGAQDYIAKPFLPDDLIARSFKLLKRDA